MEIKLKEMDNITILFNLIKGINDEAYMRINPDGIILEAMDKSNIMLVKINMNKEFFDTYEVETDNQFFVNFDIISKIINSMEGGFNLKDSENELEFKGKSIKRKLRKMQEDNPGKNIKAEYKQTFKIESREFFQKIKTAFEVGETIHFKLEDVLKIFNKNKFEDIELELISESTGQGFQQTYLSAEYLLKLEIVKNLTNELNVSFDEDAPFYMNITQPTFKIEAWLANKINQDDN